MYFVFFGFLMIAVSAIVLPWLKKNTRAAIIFMGLVSLGVTLLGLPLFENLGQLGKVSSVQGSSLVVVFVMALIVCTLGFLAVSALCAVSTVKPDKSKKKLEKHFHDCRCDCGGYADAFNAECGYTSQYLETLNIREL
ncbi:MAG: hypothetical protein LBD45_03710 [Bacteroidales bacterium]|jgi:hypothetical protein|nr:hypothetical protein [Bacteroidales bacterium]